MKQKNYFSCLITSIFVMFCVKGFAQGTGNHLTMYLDNCIEKSLSAIEFDVWVVSDGASTSDLRANAFQFGINFNTGILQSGATITPSYISGSSDFTNLNTGWCFPPGKYPDHIRAIQRVYGLGNTNRTMVIGHPYRIGRFHLTCSSDWVPSNSANFSLQDSVIIGKTVSESLVWIGSAAVCTKSIYVTGTTDDKRSLGTNCNLVTSVNDLAESAHLSIYPNPVPRGGSMIHIALDKILHRGVISIYDVVGSRIHSEAFDGREKAVSCELSSGVYVVQIRNDESQYTQKIIVQ